MRSMRSSISRSRPDRDSTPGTRTAFQSDLVTLSSDSAADTGEDLLEVEERLEAGRLPEAAAVQRAGVLEEIDRARWSQNEPEAEERPEEHVHRGLGDRDGRAARLGDGDRERHGA